jgi:hypothetical protein
VRQRNIVNIVETKRMLFCVSVSRHAAKRKKAGGKVKKGFLLALVSATTDRPELQLQTNGVWVAADMEINVSSNFTVNGVHAVLNDGPNPALNRVSVGGSMNVGNNSGTGVLSLCGGTYTNSSTTAWHYVGHTSPGYGRLEVSGGTNQIVAAGASMAAGRAGRGALSISGGLTVFKGWLYMAMYAGSECELTVTGGRLDLTYLSVGRIGQGRFTCSGGEVNRTGAFYISQLTNGVGAVTIALTGYAAADLIATLPLIRTPSPIDISQITVTMDGETLSGVSAVTRTDQGQTLLGVKYFPGTLISIR